VTLDFFGYGSICVIDYGNVVDVSCIKYNALFFKYLVEVCVFLKL
jgi:hypothetical protein